MMIKFLSGREDNERLGIVPAFFAQGVIAARFAGGGIATVADEMNETYGMGGFSDHWKGDIDDNGVYHNEHEKMEPFASVSFGGWTMWAYPHQIFGIKDNVGNQRVGRFD
jgi:hypothetical protein|tara:strand:+ start:328 stop:657 length:330 start_codon:yes stop_codon:yes gene_type:complete